MPVYRYLAKDQQGTAVTGVSKVGSQAHLIETLRKKELVIISITEEKQGRVFSFQTGGVRLDDIVLFSRQLATMVDSGIPLVQSLDILTEQIENLTFRKIVSRVRDEVETGNSLSGALGKHPRVFSPLYLSMVRAGESSGMLDDILDRLATYLEKSAALQRKVKSALVYPAVVVTMAVLITGFLILKVIPTFKGIFETLGGELPLPTQILIAVSDIARRFFLLGAAALFFLVILLNVYTRTERGRWQRDAFLMHLLIIGPLFQKATIAKFARTLSTLVKSGVPILASLEIVSKTAGNKVIEKAVDEARVSIREGEMIAPPLSKSGAFPPMVVRMIAVGEETGEMEKMLSKVADFYEEQVDAAVSALTSIIEPLIIAFLGIVVGGIVVAMFLPIFKLTEIIGR